MPRLPDGSFARGEKWFALRGRPKNHTEEFWARYDGFGSALLAFQESEAGITPLHKAAAFGWPQQAQFILARNREQVETTTSLGQTARDIALRGVEWCEANNRPDDEREQHSEVARFCLMAERGEEITFTVTGTND
ncbi:unnamed protein product [Polarella glacialis]|uniref:Uncharacterized protein n=1 Tax=Polarella glacialis TaxID=89957 RepID=A0A813EBW5_POLGL|nr:unnamed protein product [Polarella glacialis]CAE8612445.1 unnamed protein product [Polarella glacialis]